MRLVFECVDRSAGVPGGLDLLAWRGRAGRLAGAPDEYDDRAVGGGRQPFGQVVGKGGREGFGPQLQDSEGPAGISRVRCVVRRVRTAADRRDTGELVAVGQCLRGPGVLAVPGESDRGTPRREDRELGHQRRPAVFDGGAGGQVEWHLAGPGQLALHGEQAQPDPQAALVPLILLVRVGHRGCSRFSHETSRRGGRRRPAGSWH